MKKILLYSVFVLILMQIALAGVTNPLPSELNLFKGESGRFKFQVQTINSNQEVECTALLPDTSVLSIEFDPPVIVIPAGSVQDIYGTVDPRDLDYGTYREEFCISCTPTDSPSGAAVAVETCGLPIVVNVVDERAKDNMYIPPKPFPFYGKVIIVVTVILVILALIFYLFWKKKQEEVIKPAKKRTVKKKKKPKKKK